ncbi:LysR substrate-binding domain-containing protein [Roseinatronobacter sp.]
MLRTALSGGGITFAPVESLQPHIDNGKLVLVLEDFLPPFPGCYLFFPQRRNMAPKLRALVDHVQKWKSNRSLCDAK